MQATHFRKDQQPLAQPLSLARGMNRDMLAEERGVASPVWGSVETPLWSDVTPTALPQ
jgi:hypothetical protein